MVDLEFVETGNGRPEISVRTKGNISSKDQHILERVIRQVYDEGAERALELNEKDYQLAEAHRLDPTIRKFVIITEHQIVTRATLTQSEGWFNRKSYSFEIMSEVSPKRNVQAEKY